MSPFWEWILVQLRDEASQMQAAAIVSSIEDALGYEEQLLDRYVRILGADLHVLQRRAVPWRRRLETAISRAPRGQRSIGPITFLGGR